MSATDILKLGSGHPGNLQGEASAIQMQQSTKEGGERHHAPWTHAAKDLVLSRCLAFIEAECFPNQPRLSRTGLNSLALTTELESLALNANSHAGFKPLYDRMTKFKGCMTWARQASPQCERCHCLYQCTRPADSSSVLVRPYPRQSIQSAHCSGRLIPRLESSLKTTSVLLDIKGHL